MAVWFSADHHFGHRRIIQHCSRPFLGVGDMDYHLRKTWNRRVKPTDLVYYLGDFAFRSPRDYMERTLRGLNGRKILIVGNHDGKRTLKLDGWHEIDKYREFTLDGKRLVLLHYPIRSWSRKAHGAWHLHGHSHGMAPEDRTQPGILDVGIDTDPHYGPIAWVTIRELLERRDAAC